MTRSHFKKASLATEGDGAGIDFYYASLDGASFEEASLTTKCPHVLVQ